MVSGSAKSDHFLLSWIVFFLILNFGMVKVYIFISQHVMIPISLMFYNLLSTLMDLLSMKLNTILNVFLDFPARD